MAKNTYDLQIDLSGDIYRAEDGLHECHFSLYTEPSKGILVWQENQENVQVKNSILTVKLGTSKPVYNIIWVYQVLWLNIELSTHHHKIAFKTRFKIIHHSQ